MRREMELENVSMMKRNALMKLRLIWDAVRKDRLRRIIAEMRRVTKIHSADMAVMKARLTAHSRGSRMIARAFAVLVGGSLRAAILTFRLSCTSGNTNIVLESVEESHKEELASVVKTHKLERGMFRLEQTLLGMLGHEMRLLYRTWSQKILKQAHKSTNQIFLESIEKQTAENEELQEVNTQLQEENDSILKDNTKLQEKHGSMLADNTKLQEENGIMLAELEELRKNNGIMLAELEELRKKIQRRRKRERLRRSSRR